MKAQSYAAALARLLCLAIIAASIAIPGYAVKAEGTSLIEYSGHQQSVGDLNTVSDGAILGVTGKSLRLEALCIKKGNALAGLSGDIQCQAHVQSIGNTQWIGSGSSIGTKGRSLRIEALRLRLTGDIAEQYDIYYSVHLQGLGWTGWAKGIEGDSEVGGWCGTKGLSRRIEAIRIKMVATDAEKPASDTDFTYYAGADDSKLTYSGHQQKIGDIAPVAEGKTLGYIGRSLRLEAISISLDDSVKLSASDSIQYKVHVQNDGWQDWRKDGALAGTTGKSKRLEAICIKLTGDIADRYDVWYRVHCQKNGWMGWAKNGEAAGTEGYGRRMEAIEIKLLPKELGAPGSTTKPYVQKKYSGKLVALTFDDGPGARCGEILDCLAANDAHATFYVVGSNARLRPELLTRMESIGCEVGNHSNSHAILSRLSASGIQNELEIVNSTLRDTLGHNAVTMRPPGGGYNATVQAVVDAPIILWSIDTLDWKTRNTQKTIDSVLNNVQDGDIILMHDIHSPTVDAALYLIPELKKRGYTLVTVSELAEAKGVELKPGQVYKRIQ